MKIHSQSMEHLLAQVMCQQCIIAHEHTSQELLPKPADVIDAGPELLTHMADGLPTGKTWLRGSESLPSPSCTQGPCKSRSVRKISCTLDGDVVSVSYSRKVCPLSKLFRVCS